MTNEELLRFGFAFDAGWGWEGGYACVTPEPVPDVVWHTYESEAGKLVVEVREEFFVGWVLMANEGSNADGTNAHYVVTAHGDGCGGTLREQRHTWFGADGDNGYVYSVQPAFLAWGFALLAKWFDYQGAPPREWPEYDE